jgi:prophage antirepressor-like protein
LICQDFFFQDKQKVQVVDQNGEPCFVARDVVRFLGYSENMIAMKAENKELKSKAVNLEAKADVLEEEFNQFASSEGH